MTKSIEVATSYPLGPALDFLRRFWQLSQSVEKLSRRMDKSIGVTAQQRLIVRCLGKYPGITPSQLAALLHLDPGSISAALNRLESKKMLERHRNPRDKRRAYLNLTAKGRRLDRVAHGTVESAVQRLIDDTPAREITRLVKVVGKLTAFVGEELRE